MEEINLKGVNIAVVGATGMVGRNFLKILDERKSKKDNKITVK